MRNLISAVILSATMLAANASLAQQFYPDPFASRPVWVKYCNEPAADGSQQCWKRLENRIVVQTLPQRGFNQNFGPRDGFHQPNRRRSCLIGIGLVRVLGVCPL
jgi:hypothetical protein